MKDNKILDKIPANNTEAIIKNQEENISIKLANNNPIIDNIEVTGRKHKKTNRYIYNRQEIESVISILSKYNITISDICNILNIRYNTLSKYISKYNLNNIIESSKCKTNIKIIDSLISKCLGYTKQVKQVYITKDGEKIEYTEEKYYPPDTLAIMFYLRSRVPEQYNVKQDINTNINIKHSIDNVIQDYNSYKRIINADSCKLLKRIGGNEEL